MNSFDMHYGGDDNPHEPIKIIEYYDLNFSLGNVIKYILRAGVKHPGVDGKIQDLAKAKYYINRELDRLEKMDGDNE